MNRKMIHIPGILIIMGTLAACTVKEDRKSGNGAHTNPGHVRPQNARIDEAPASTPKTKIGTASDRPVNEDGTINAFIEISAGTLEKWEINHANGQLELEQRGGKPRIVEYLGYPGNYGMIPGTLLPKEKGGDGDPLDIIVLGPPIERGKTIACKLIGVLWLLDRGDQDDKLIAISKDSPMYHVNSLDELNEQYVGAAEIIKIWFSNYKGPGKMVCNGFGSKEEARQLLKRSMIR